MGRLSSAWSALVGSKKGEEFGIEPGDAQKWAHLFSSSSAAGVRVSEKTVFEMTTSWRCIRLISETISTLPLDLLRKTDSGTEKAKDHRLYRLLHSQPNPYNTSVEWVEGMVVSLCVYGQAYNAIERFGGEVRAIMPVHKQDVKAVKENGRPVYYHSDGGVQIPKNARDICPIKGFGAPASIEGLPPYQIHSNSIGLTMAAESYGANFFSSGGAPSGIFSGEKWPSAEDVSFFDKLFKSRGNRPLFIGGDYKYQSIDAENQSAQFMELREFQVREIANIWGVPSDRVLSKGGDTYNNTEQRNLQFLQTTLLPYIRRIEKSLEMWLLNDDERDAYEIRFNFEGLLRGDSKSRSEYYRNMRNIAGMTVNELRRLERLPEVDGGDDLHMPLNMAPLDALEGKENENS